MDKSQIYEKLRTIMCEVFDEEDIVPHPEMTAAEVDSWDSLSNIRLVVAVEEEFDIHFTTAEITDLGNVGEFVEVIGARITE